MSQAALRSKLASFAEELQQQLENNPTQTKAKKDVNKVIEHFGSINAMLYLCLSNPNCTDFINEETLASLKSTIMMGNPAHTESPTESLNTNTDNNIIATPKMYCPVFSNLAQFYTHSMALLVDPYDNLYFKIFNLSSEKNRFIVDALLFSKWFFAVAVVTNLSVSITGEVYGRYFGYDWFYQLMRSMAWLIVLIVSVPYSLTPNVKIFELTIQTFDFWYKTYNIILSIIAEYVLGGFENGYDFALVGFASLFTFATLFLFDAICVSNIMKNIVTFLVVLALVGVINDTYFEYEDYFWNPFDSNHTRISFKSIKMGADTNLALFILKPFFSQISRACRKKCGSNNSGRHIISNKMKQRSSFLYKRPAIEWKIEMIHDNSNNIKQLEFIQSGSRTPHTN